jgi:hypothetical protein
LSPVFELIPPRGRWVACIQAGGGSKFLTEEFESLTEETGFLTEEMKMLTEESEMPAQWVRGWVQGCQMYSGAPFSARLAGAYRHPAEKGLLFAGRFCCEVVAFPRWEPVD